MNVKRLAGIRQANRADAGSCALGLAWSSLRLLEALPSSLNQRWAVDVLTLAEDQMPRWRIDGQECGQVRSDVFSERRTGTAMAGGAKQSLIHRDPRWRTQTLRALRSKSCKAIIKERLTVATDKREIEQLRLCL